MYVLLSLTYALLNLSCDGDETLQSCGLDTYVASAWAGGNGGAETFLYHPSYYDTTFHNFCAHFYERDCDESLQNYFLYARNNF